MKSIRGAALVISLLLLTAASSFALPYTCITNNGNGCAAMSSQLSITIQSVAGLPVFTFVNAGPTASVITGLYWDDDNNLLSSIITLAGSAGVAFTAGGSPASLPSENTATPAFVSDTTLTATADSPAPTNGINPGESLSETFSLQGATTYAQVLAAFNAGTLRSGIHVQSIGGPTGGSDSLVNGVNGLQVPEPITLLLLGFGLLGLTGMRRFRK